MQKSISRAHAIDHVYMADAVWCHAQIADGDGVCVHGDKAALPYKPAHFTACCSLLQVWNGALDANLWPGAAFITNANEIEDINVQILFTNGASGVQEVISSAFWLMVLHLQRKRSWKNSHSLQMCLLKNAEALEAADRWMSGFFYHN